MKNTIVQHSDRKASWKWVSGYAFGLFLIALFIGSCTKSTPTPPAEVKKNLNIKVLQTAGFLQDESFSQVANQYAQAHPELVVNCTPEVVSPDLAVENLAAQLNQYDVVIFSSVLNEKFRPQTSLFYPIQGIDLEMPPVIDTVYAGSAESSPWALPLLMDPVVVVVKKSGADDAYFPSDWQSILLRAQLLEKKQPYLVFLSEFPTELGDSIASQQFAAGYLRDTLLKTPPEEGITETEQLAACGRALQNMKSLMIDSEQSRVVEIPQVKNLESFIESDAHAAIATYSQYRKLPETARQMLFVRDFPKNFKAISTCALVAIAIPLQSANPSLGEDFIRYVVSQLDSLAAQQNLFPVRMPDNPEKGIGFFERNTVFVPRENANALSDKIVIDTMNGDLKISDLNNLWLPSFYIPGNTF